MGELSHYQDEETGEDADGSTLGGGAAGPGGKEGWRTRAKEVDEAEDEYEKWCVN